MQEVSVITDAHTVRQTESAGDKSKISRKQSWSGGHSQQIFSHLIPYKIKELQDTMPRPYATPPVSVHCRPTWPELSL